MKAHRQMALLDAVRLLVATQGMVQFDFTPNGHSTPYPPRFKHARPPKRRARRQCAMVKR